jgi:tetratricopeptide (TPR) repeat protein
MASMFDKLFKRQPVEAPASATAPASAAAPASAPGRFDALCSQAAQAAANRDLQRAIQLLDQAIALEPARAEPHYKRANALKDLGRLEAAVAGYDQAIERKPDYTYAYCNRGFVQHGLGLLDAALSSYDQAIAIDATDPFTHYNRALLLQDYSRWEQALASYDRAVALNPQFADAQYNRAVCMLFQGDFENGWPPYEWRWKNARRLGIGDLRDFPRPLWLGDAPIRGRRLLLHSEAGLGDTMQFCRYAKLAAAQGATVLLEVQPPLADLLGSLEGVSQIIAKGSALPSFDYHCPLMSLPLAFKTTLDTIPAFPQYLRSDPAKVAQWRSLLGEKVCPRIGLVWSGNPNNPIDARRNIQLADWIEHLSPGFQYFRLQTEVREADQDVLDSSDTIFSYDDDLLDFANTAALCECMDLVISVDTSLAHLGGALGQRTWVLLPFTPDWRWLRDRDASPWYPTMKLYRQRAAGDWKDVFARVAADMHREWRK